MLYSEKANRISNYIIAAIFFLIGVLLLFGSLLAVGGICGPYLTPIQGLLCVFGAVVCFVIFGMIIVHTSKSRSPYNSVSSHGRKMK